MTESNIMPTALFFNFSDEDFTGMWGGQTRLFPAGSKTYMPAYLAQHFAKHLTNRELHKQGNDTATSPKVPEDVPAFNDMFRRAYVRDRDMEKNRTSLDSEIDSVNLNRGGSPSMDLDFNAPSSVAPKVEKELDLNNPEGSSRNARGDQPQIIDVPDDDEEDENAAFESKPVVVPAATETAKPTIAVGL